MNNKIMLIVGKSGSGKTTVAKNLFNVYGLSQIESYTTRPKRHENEFGHIFVNSSEFNELKELVGYTNFNGYEYCATSKQVENNQIYVIDCKGVDFFKHNYKGNKKILTVYLNVEDEILTQRMKNRGDNLSDIYNRIENDKKEFKSYLDICDYVVDNINMETTTDILYLLYENN